MESTSKLLSGTFQRSCVITNYTEQNNLRGTILQNSRFFLPQNWFSIA